MDYLFSNMSYTEIISSKEIKLEISALNLVIGKIDLMYSINDSLSIHIFIRMTSARQFFNVKHHTTIPCPCKLKQLSECWNSLTGIQLSLGFRQ